MSPSAATPHTPLTSLLLYPLSRNLFISIRWVSQQESLIAGREASFTSTHTHTLRHTHTCSTHFPICSVSHFYICNPRSFVILLLHVSLKREKLISGVKRDYQMQTKSPPPPDKDIDVDFFSREQKKKKRLKACFSPGWQLSRKKQVNCHTGNYFLSAPGNRLDNGEEMLSWWRENTRRSDCSEHNQLPPLCFFLGVLWKWQIYKKEKVAVEVSTCVHVSYKEQLAVVTAECYYINEGSSRRLGLFFCRLTARQIIPITFPLASLN